MNFLDTLHEHFGKQNVTPIESHQGVFLCEKKTPDEIIYQIIYIDTSNKWCEPDYSKYIDSIVIDKYYQTEGFLQWNYYYYFITTDELIKANGSRKIEIENDETYSRKFILTEGEFTDWLISFDSISKISKDTISNDLYTSWVNYLREKKLYFVFNSDKYPNYKQPLEDYINGLSSDDVEEVEQTDFANNSEPVLKKINNLELLEFREHPLIRNFPLGDVNLIHGANAVGKTSFFDAIELIITGELFYKSVNDRYSLQLTDDSHNILKYPAKPSPYKNRDIQWYSSGANRSNKLNGNFNKFNYFTSDAAFQLKQNDGDEGNNLEKIIADIALGREVNKLEERIKGFAERFIASADGFLKESTRLNENLSEKNDTIKAINAIQRNPQGYKDALIDSLKNNFWKTTIDDRDDFIAKLDNEIQTVNNTLFNIQSKNIGVDVLSVDSMKKELEGLSIKQLSIAAIKNEILKSQQQKQTNLKEIEKIKTILPVIEDLSLYYKHEQFSFLVGLENNIKKKNIDLNKAKEIKQLADSILSTDYFAKESEKEKTINQLETEIKERQGSLNKKLKDTQLKISQVEDGIEELSIIVSNIKMGGHSYLKLNPKAEECPLCNTPFSNEMLAEAIQKTQDSFTNSIALISFKEELEFISKRLDEIDKQLEIITKLKRLAFTIFVSNGLEKTFTELKRSSEENTKTLTSLTESLIHLNTIQSQFNNSGLTEERFVTLLNQVKEYFSLSIISNSELDLHKINLLDNQTELIGVNNQLEKELEIKGFHLKNNFTTEIANEEQLLKRLNVLKEIESNFLQIEIYLDFPSSTLLINILEKTKSVASVFETYKKAALEAKQHNQVIDITKKEIEKILAEIEVIKPKQSRAQFANIELNKLLDEQSKNKYLSEYIAKNKTEIVSIFKLIHTPREFKDINFKDNIITLISNEGEERTLSEISTGQRSALALSIFLSLNKKLAKGPNILMFDDPVTYVDDMNVLSFFDYLRELVIKSKRQVFFATANDDLAFLFRKKFEFLGDELTTHKLERKNDN